MSRLEEEEEEEVEDLERVATRRAERAPEEEETLGRDDEVTEGGAGRVCVCVCVLAMFQTRKGRKNNFQFLIKAHGQHFKFFRCHPSTVTISNWKIFSCCHKGRQRAVLGFVVHYYAFIMLYVALYQRSWTLTWYVSHIPWILFHLSIWYRAHRRSLERRGPFKINIRVDWTNRLSITLQTKANQIVDSWWWHITGTTVCRSSEQNSSVRSEAEISLSTM